MSFQGDERPRIYAVISRYGSNPFKMIEGTYQDLDFFLGRGNFRPLGRLFETAGHSFAFEAGEATGLAPHVVLGAVRLAMIGLLALTASAVVAALARSAGVSLRHPVNVLYPLALGTVLVASGSHGPQADRRWYNHINLVHFPHTIIGAVVLILAMALVVARDRDMQNRRLERREWGTMAALGAVSALYYDLVYLAPILAAAFIVTRAVAAGMPLKEIRSTAALRRWLVVSAGFLAAFIPARIEIIRRCAEQSCYNGTDPQFSAEALGHIPRRLLAGTPPAGWLHNAEIARHFGLDLGVEDFARNALTGLLLAAVLVMTVLAARSASLASSRDIRHPGLPETSLSSPAAARPRHLALALAVLGASAALLAALLASLSNQVHENDLRAVDSWRETLLTQVGWSLLITAAVVAVIEAARGPGSRQVVVVGAAVLLGASLATSLLANWQLSQADRHDPLSSVTSQISNATVSIDWTEEGNLHRCALIDAYSEMIPEHLNMGGPAVRKHLNQVMLNRYDQPFCDSDQPT